MKFHRTTFGFRYGDTEWTIKKTYDESIRDTMWRIEYAGERIQSWPYLKAAKKALVEYCNEYGKRL